MRKEFDPASGKKVVPAIKNGHLINAANASVIAKHVAVHGDVPDTWEENKNQAKSPHVIDNIHQKPFQKPQIANGSPRLSKDLPENKNFASSTLPDLRQIDPDKAAANIGDAQRPHTADDFIGDSDLS